MASEHFRRSMFPRRERTTDLPVSGPSESLNENIEQSPNPLLPAQPIKFVGEGDKHQQHILTGDSRSDSAFPRNPCQKAFDGAYEMVAGVVRQFARHACRAS